MQNGRELKPLEIEGTLYIDTRVLPDGRLAGVMRLMFHWSMHVGIDEIGYKDRYCYRDAGVAIAAMHAWDGTGDPEGWHRHPLSGRRRDNGIKELEIYAP